MWLAYILLITLCSISILLLLRLVMQFAGVRYHHDQLIEGQLNGLQLLSGEQKADALCPDFGDESVQESCQLFHEAYETDHELVERIASVLLNDLAMSNQFFFSVCFDRSTDSCSVNARSRVVRQFAQDSSAVYQRQRFVGGRALYKSNPLFAKGTILLPTSDSSLAGMTFLGAQALYIRMLGEPEWPIGMLAIGFASHSQARAFQRQCLAHPLFSYARIASSTIETVKSARSEDSRTRSELIGQVHDLRACQLRALSALEGIDEGSALGSEARIRAELLESIEYCSAILAEESPLLTCNETKCHPVHLADVLIPLVERFRIIARSRGLLLMVTGDTAVTLHSSPVILSRILSNFLMNALRYGSGSTVRLAIVEDDFRVKITVSNECETVLGVSQGEISKVAEGSKAILGAGVGLNSSERLARKIQADSWFKPLQNGTMVFGLSVPKSTEEVRSHSVPIDLRVIAVDDEPEVLRRLTKTLQSMVREVVSVSSLDELRVLLRDGKADVVISDFHLGQERLSMLESELVENTAVVVTSSGLSQREFDPMRNFGWIQYLEKPVPKAQLVSVLGAWQECRVANKEESSGA